MPEVFLNWITNKFQTALWGLIETYLTHEFSRTTFVGFTRKSENIQFSVIGYCKNGPEVWTDCNT